MNAADTAFIQGDAQTPEARDCVQIAIARLLLSAADSVEAQGGESPRDALLDGAMSFVADNIGRRLTVASIARRLGVSAVTLNGLFKEGAGLPPPRSRLCTSRSRLRKSAESNDGNTCGLALRKVRK